MLNLDALTDGELTKFREAIQLLDRYAQLRQIVMGKRLEGSIQSAVDLERHLDAMFKKLPEWARW